MKKNSSRETVIGPEESSRSILEELLREGARKMLQQAIENEVEEYLERYALERDERGRRLAVKNGHLPVRDIVTGLGLIPIRQPRVDDRKLRKSKTLEPFTSNILPRYLRRIPSIDNLIPVLYLKGISTGDFPRALEAILGDSVKGLSATNIVRLKAKWEEEYQQWNRRDLLKEDIRIFLGRWDILQCPSR